MKVGYVVLYEDGELVISKNHTLLQKKIIKDYCEFEDTDVPWKNNDFYKIKKIRILDQVRTMYMSDWFKDCINLTTLINFKNLDVSDCTDFSYVFYNCNSLKTLKELENWNVSNGTDMNSMFSGCTLLQDLNGLQNWNVSDCTDFSYMFYNCESLQDVNELRKWNVSNGKYFSYMFYNCESLQNINSLENWNISNMKDVSCMFEYCESLQSILLSNTLDILSKDMFYNCNPTLKIHWKNHIYTYADLLEYQTIY